MEATFLPPKDHQAASGIIRQLGDCRTSEDLNQILKISLIPLMSCSGAFYTCQERVCVPPRLLDARNPSSRCQCRWQNFLEFATQNQLVDRLLVDDKYET